MITESSSQLEENSDLKNVDVIRIQGFSKSLMHKILTINLQLRKLEAIKNDFEKVLKLDNKLNNHSEQGIVITPGKSSIFRDLRDYFIKVKTNAISRLNMLLLLENNN
jgi:hypothetical protein